MTLKSPLSEFCDRKGIDGRLKSAFGAYIRSTYAQKFLMSEAGETVHLILNRLSQEDLEDAWLDFTRDLKKYLSE